MRSAELTRMNGTRAHRARSVLIQVPAQQDYLVVVRSAVAQLGAHLGYTLEEVADLRLAVDEACCLLVARHRPDGIAAGDLECRVQVGTDTLEIVVSAGVTDVDAPAADGFGWNILLALVDTLTWSDDGDTARIDLVKRHRVRSG